MPPIEAALVKRLAAQVGFHACGIAEARSLPDYLDDLNYWLSHNYHGDMSYMQRNADKRSNPLQLLPQARSVISVLLAYKTPPLPSGVPKIARFACLPDYHDEVKQRLFRIAYLLKEHYPEIKGRPFCDTAPHSDKLWAQQAGLGWIGRNSLLVNPTYGTFHNIGSLVIDHPADHYDTPIANRCDHCHRCQEACPNKALATSPNGHPCLIATRCNAYHTIESHAEALPEDIHLRGYVYGCDICQDACPYNAAAPLSAKLSEDIAEKIKLLVDADEETFIHLTRNTPLQRISYSQWRRNLAHLNRQPYKPSTPPLPSSSE